MSKSVHDLAEKAILELVSDEAAGTLLGCFNVQMDEVIDLVEGDYELWLLVLNLIQDWYMTGHKIFKRVRFELAPPHTVDYEDYRLPVCIDPLFWRSYAPKSLRSRL